MVAHVSNVFGPFADTLSFDNGTSYQLSKPATPAASLVGYGDTVQVGDWVYVLDPKGGPHAHHAGMPLQILHYSLDRSHPVMSLANRVTNAQFCYAEPDTGRVWRAFRRVEEQDVPLYLREEPQVALEVLHRLRQLTKAQLLERYQGQAETECYTVLSRIWPDAPGTRPAFVRREPMPLEFAWEQKPGKRRLVLKMLRQKWETNGTGDHLWGAGESRTDQAGNIVAQRHYCMALYAEDGAGELLSAFLRHATIPKWMEGAKLPRLAK